LTHRPGEAIRASVPAMIKPKGMQRARDIVFAGVAMSAIANAWAAGGVWVPNSSLGPQLTVYVSQPLWERGSSARSYGLRLEQVRSDVGLPRRAEFGAVHRKALIDLQVRPHAGTRLEFAARVSWDLGRESFGPTPDGSSRVINLAFRGRVLADKLSFQPWTARTHGLATAPRFVWRCDTVSTEAVASHARHRTDDLVGACDALAMTADRPAVAF
jgi:hypothetical protein